MTTMDQEQQATTPRALWTLIVAGPAIVAIQMQANFILVRQACSAQRNVALYAVIILAMLLTIATVLVAISLWKRAGTVWPTEAIDLANRIRFITALGILSSAMSFLVILAQGIATVVFDPCQL
jgi:vacuolar-type H+-ATPase subunit I/STV1